MDNPINNEGLYLCNPDVVLREEDEAGGLLFNPDTNQIKIVNFTGLFIWKLFAFPNKLVNVLNEILNNFEDADNEVVLTDLQEFLGEMLEHGFIGEMVP